MKPLLEVRLASAVRLALSLALAVVTLAFGKSVYDDLYRVILDGFDRKLKALSTVTGALIDGEIHRQLERPYGLQGLVYDPHRRTLLSSDGHQLVTLDQELGYARPIQAPELGELEGLAFDPWADRPLALDAQGRLVEVHPESGELRARFQIPIPDCLGLAWERSTEALYCATPGVLVRFEPDQGTVEALGRLDGVFRWLTPGPPGWLLGFDTETGTIRAIAVSEDARSGTEPAPRDLTPPVEDLEKGIRGLARDPDDGAVWILSDRLVRLAGGEGRSAGPVGFRSEQSPAYLDYVRPMRRIREQTGITYLYTQIPHEDPGRCIYILDANEDEDHPELGAEDDLPEDSSYGQRRVLGRAEVYLSPVRSWDRWGLLKVAFAPIFDGEGRVRAIAGADVDISIIRDKTRASLVRVLLTGGLSLVLGMLVAGLVARKVTGPVAEIQEAALSLTANRFGRRIEGGRLVELRQLAQGLSGVGGALEETLARFGRNHTEFETRRRVEEMEDFLQDRQLAWAASPGASDRRWDWSSSPDPRSASGSLATPAGDLVWIAPRLEDSEEGLRRRREVAEILARGLDLAAAAGRPPLEELEDLYPKWIGALLWIRAGGTALDWLAREPLTLAEIDAAGDIRPWTLEGWGSRQRVAGTRLQIPDATVEESPCS